MRSLINITSLLLLLLAVAHQSTAQDKPAVALRTFVKQDTVLLRWAPTSTDLFIKGLKYGYTIERIEGSGSFENSTSLQTFAISPFSETKKQYATSSDKNLVAMIGFTDELISSASLSDNTKNMAFSILMLSAATNKDLAKMLGIYYEQRVPAGAPATQYSYRIDIHNEKSNVAVVDVSVLSQNQVFTTLNGSARTKLKQAYLSWEAKSLQQGYAAYWIERSTDSVNFERRNNVPYLFLKSQDEPNKINCDFVDTNVIEGGTYYYRITGINHFAETGNSSNIVTVYVPKSLYGECRIDTVFAEGMSRKINGHFAGAASRVSGTGNNAPSRFILMRSDSIQFGYTVIAEKPNTNNSYDFSASVPVESGDRYYYKVAALSEDHDTVYSFPYYFFTLDQIPPSVPQNLAGIVNDSGIVSLTWTANPENDIRGYRVFRSNSLKEEFTEVTQEYCTATSFRDTLRLDNLTATVYYRMAAVDLNFNNSERCAPLLLMKPDTIPPVRALFLDYSVKQNGILLTWVNSTSVDLAGHHLVRTYGGISDTLYQWQDTTSNFFDSTGLVGRSYNYQLVAADLSGNRSISDFLFVNYETGMRPGVSAIEASVNRAEKSITLSWVLPEGELYSVQVYRSKNDEPFRLVKTIREIPVTSFIDKDLGINNYYRYKVVVIYDSGVRSPMSEAFLVTY